MATDGKTRVILRRFISGERAAIAIFPDNPGKAPDTVMAYTLKDCFIEVNYITTMGQSYTAHYLDQDVQNIVSNKDFLALAPKPFFTSKRAPSAKAVAAT